MKLNVDRLGVGERQRLQPQNWIAQKNGSSWERELQPSTWVKLLELPSPFSFDEALLLCKCSDSEWLAWIPEWGEAVLHTRQFCLVG